MGYNSWGHKELDMTKQLTHTHTQKRLWGEHKRCCRDWKVCPEEKGSGPFSKATEWDEAPWMSEISP